MDIKIIKVEQTYPLRHKVLRPAKELNACFFLGDHDEKTTHWGIHTQEQLIGIASIYNTNPAAMNINNAWQLRGMAIDEQYRNQGYGRYLLLGIENYLRHHHLQSDRGKDSVTYIWANARLNALPFYQSVGYGTYGTQFEIENVGTHYLIYKQL